MPQRPAAKKSLRQDRKRTLRNKGIKSRLTTETTKFERALERKDFKAAGKQMNLLTKLYHKAAVKGVLHKNKAAREQAKLQKLANKVQAGG